jgi:predicted amino acid-binding ACT domain protein
VVRARCCNPIRGEKIVGYISRGKGVSVHSASCSNVVNLMYDPDRRIEVEWDSAGREEGAFTVRLAVQVEDKKGMVAAVSAKVAGMNTNIRSMEATTEDTRGRIDMTVEIADMKHLEKVIKSVKAVSGVLDVERTMSESGPVSSAELLATLAGNLHRWDNGAWSLYDLYPHPVPNVASSFYHLLHIHQLEELSASHPRLPAFAQRSFLKTARGQGRTRAGGVVDGHVGSRPRRPQQVHHQMAGR